MQLTIQEFKALSLPKKAEAYQQWIKSLKAPFPEGLLPSLELRWDLGHLGIGLSGELIESLLEMEKGSQDYMSSDELVIKEVGDIVWYAVSILNRVLPDMSFADMILRTSTIHTRGHVCVSMNYWLQLITIAEPVIDQCKRIYAYGQEDLSPIQTYIEQLLQYILAHNCIEVILDVNYDKLCTRFPNKLFTLEDATIKRA